VRGPNLDLRLDVDRNEIALLVGAVFAQPAAGQLGRSVHSGS
jgi:hypothetical protein